MFTADARVDYSSAPGGMAGSRDEIAEWLRTDLALIPMKPSAQGSKVEYYRQFAAAVNGPGPQPVPATEAVHTRAVLDAARVSATEGSPEHG